MAKLLVSRPMEFRNGLRSYKINVDGKNIGSIASGEILEYEISSGSHDIIAKIDWCSSSNIQFNISDEETKEINVKANDKKSWVFPIIAILLFLIILFRKNSFSKYLPLIFIGVLILSIYYLTLGRKKYLNLSEN